LLYFKLDTPYQLFSEKISFAVLSPLLNTSKRHFLRGDTEGRQEGGGGV